MRVGQGPPTMLANGHGCAPQSPTSPHRQFTQGIEVGLTEEEGWGRDVGLTEEEGWGRDAKKELLPLVHGGQAGGSGGGLGTSQDASKKACMPLTVSSCSIFLKSTPSTSSMALVWSWSAPTRPAQPWLSVTAARAATQTAGMLGGSPVAALCAQQCTTCQDDTGSAPGRPVHTWRSAGCGSRRGHTSATSHLSGRSAGQRAPGRVGGPCHRAPPCPGPAAGPLPGLHSLRGQD